MCVQNEGLKGEVERHLVDIFFPFKSFFKFSHPQDDSKRNDCALSVEREAGRNRTLKNAESCDDLNFCRRKKKHKELTIQNVSKRHQTGYKRPISLYTRQTNTYTKTL